MQTINSERGNGQFLGLNFISLDPGAKRPLIMDSHFFSSFSVVYCKPSSGTTVKPNQAN